MLSGCAHEDEMGEEHGLSERVFPWEALGILSQRLAAVRFI
ncbi:MAG: hypothetical protein SCH70_13350 [Candidatus Methanoperedens sp.]|nr:hypothetical protein [Candidatus Methanoperedens sp.]